MATWSVGSIDSLAPARSPFGLRLCRSAPAGSIPAGDTAAASQSLANLRVVQSEGSIDSLSPESSPLAGFVYVAPLPRAPFPPGT